MEEREEAESETEEESLSAISVESSVHPPDASNYDGKLRFYAEECKRYSIENAQIIRECMAEIRVDCNLQNFLIGSLQCQVMFEAFARVPVTRLVAVNLRENHLDHFCCPSMASFIDMSNTLCELNLEGCQIGDRGVEILSAVLATSISIARLNLSGNRITDAGGAVLAGFLMKNSFCADLTVACNQLSLKTATVLGEALAVNETLKRLDLRHNCFHEQLAGAEIMKGIGRNETLEYLDLSWNAIYGNEFGKTLSKCVKKSGLKVFKLEHNRLESFDFQKLALGIKYSPVIEAVYVGWNCFAPNDDVVLMKVLATDTPLQLLSFGDSFHLSHEAFGLLKDITATKPSLRVIYRGILLPNPPRDVSMLDICADRAKLLAMKPKQKRLRRDMRVFMIKLRSLESRYVLQADFMKLLNAFNAKLDAKLVQQYVDVCLASNERLHIVDVHMMANHYLSRHPIQ